jgi:predicted  nucleic acid-binding Zn-ribbon protein
MEETEQIARLKAEVAELREVLEDLSDHNSALERMRFIKALDAEIQAQAAEITRLRGLLEQK